jgi:hypothetical protein
VTQFVVLPCACAGEPRAGNRASVERDWEACLAAGYKAPGNERGNCPRVARASAFRALCSHGLCEAVER